MCPGPIQKSKSEPTSQQRGADRLCLSRRSTLFVSKSDDDASTLGKESSMRKNSRSKLSRAFRDEIAQRQKEEVSSRDKAATSTDTDAVPMQRWRTDRIIEECSQYHPDRV